MELAHKTTILIDRAMHERLTRLARQRGVSMGRLVRDAVEAQYGYVDPGDRAAAVDQLAALELPVGEVSAMKSESQPFTVDPLP